uniref:Uncharacterized protein n=1 Tax=Oryza brachyantha TaxID=4533 RepID=J3MM67_ORYBR
TTRSFPLRNNRKFEKDIIIPGRRHGLRRITGGQDILDVSIDRSRTKCELRLGDSVAVSQCA